MSEPQSIIVSNVPNVIVRPARKRLSQVVFFDEGEDAGFRIGNSELRLSYAEALRFAQLLRVHAKAAKRRAGDNGRHWSLVAELEARKG